MKYSRATTALLIFWSFLQLIGVMTAVDAMTLRVGHALFLTAIAFLTLPRLKGDAKDGLRSAGNVALSVVGAAAFIYVWFRYADLASGSARPGAFDAVVAGAALLCVFEAGRRAAPGLMWLALGFFLYNFIGPLLPGALGHPGFSPRRVLQHLFYGTGGVFGVGVGVSATYIFAFMLFGSILQASGFSAFLNDLMMALVGRYAGGPAKVSVLASALLGMMNGSATANVATTGAFTIPLMKKNGYSPAFAGAVEAVASTGGQFTPPVMGAVGFLMAEFLGVPYKTVALAAIVPAALYYLTVILGVHFEAKRRGLKGLSQKNLPRAGEVFKRDWHLTIPVALLLGLMFMGFTPLYACILSSVATVAAAAVRKRTRMSVKTVLKAVSEGANAAVPIGVCCMLIGVIIGTVSLTGLGLTLGSALMNLASGGSLFVTALAAMLFCVILGTGVPGRAAYVIVSGIAAPALEKAGATVLSAHMFCLVYACLANITPPVAMSAYVASGIAGSTLKETAFQSVKLGLGGFVVPFFFIQNPALLLGADADILVSARSVVTAGLGCAMLAAAVFRGRAGERDWLSRAMFLAGAACTLDGGLFTDILGVLFGLAAIVFIYCKERRKREK